jgi:hypothetical protein
MTKWVAYAKNNDLARWEAFGWVADHEALKHTSHGEWSTLVVYEGPFEPRRPSDHDGFKFPEEPHRDQPVETVEHHTTKWEDFPETKTTKASTILETAAAIVDGDREGTYGDVLTGHKSIACLWNGYFRGAGVDVEVNAVDVANMEALQKMARSLGGTFNLDDYVDGAAYVAIAGELQQRTGGTY